MNSGAISPLSADSPAALPEETALSVPESTGEQASKPLLNPQNLADLFAEKPETKTPPKTSNIAEKETPVAEENTTTETVKAPVQKFLHPVVRAGLALFVLGIFLFFGSLAVPDVGQSTEILPHLIPKVGKAFVTDIFTGQETLLHAEKALTENTTIHTAEAAQADLDLGKKGLVRIAADSTMNFQMADDPHITFQKGDVWINALQNIFLETEHYRFSLADGSAHISRTADGVKITTWENNLPIAIRDENGIWKELLVFPPLSNGFFPEGAAYQSRAAILPKLRFSKLLKEFQVTSALATPEDTADLRQDEALRTDYAEQFLTAQNEAISGISAKFIAFLGVFPHEKDQAQKMNEASNAGDLIAAVHLGDMFRAREIIAAHPFTASTLRELISGVQLAEATFPDKKTRSLLEDELLQQLPSNAHLTYTTEILRNAFHGLQKSLTLQDPLWRDTEIARIRHVWGIATTTSRFADVNGSASREALFRLLMQNPEEVTSDLADFFRFLDTTEIASAPAEERDTVLLEVVQKDLALSAALLPVKKVAIAKTLLTASTEVLAKIPTTVPSAALENLQHLTTEIQQRLAACTSFDVCDSTTFTTWISSKKIVACQLEKVCSTEQFALWINDFLSGKLKASAPDATSENNPEQSDPTQEANNMLTTLGITLEKGQMESDGNFFIVRARTKENIIFSGKLAVEYGYLTEVVTAEGQKIEGTVSLSSLSEVLYRTVYPEETLPTNTTNTEPLKSPLDPVIADLTVRTLQPDLLAAGFIVLRNDMVPESTSYIHVQHALAGAAKVPVKFAYIVRKSPAAQILQDVTFEAYPDLSIPEVNLADAAEQIVALANKEEKRQALQDQVLSLFTRAGFTISKTDVTPTETENIVHFQKLFDPMSQLTFTGTLNFFTQVFLTLTDETGKIRLRDIPLSEYRHLVQPAETPEAEKISAADQKKAQQALEQNSSNSSNTPSTTQK